MNNTEDNCMTYDVPEIVEIKKELKIALIFSGIGFVVGTIIGLVDSGIEYILLGMWIGIGIGGIIPFIPLVPRIFKRSYEKNKNNLMDLKDNIKVAIQTVLINIVFWPIIFIILGPIGLLIRVLRKLYEIKKIKKKINNTKQ